MLILRATDLLESGRSHESAAQIALLIYAGYNAAATITSLPAGRLGDRGSMVRILAVGAGMFLVAYVGFAWTGASVVLLAGCFVAAGVGIGCAETAEHAAVAELAPEHLRGSAFGLLAALQAVGSLAASAIAGILWTAISPTAAFAYAAARMVVALIGLAFALGPESPRDGPREDRGS